MPKVWYKRLHLQHALTDWCYHCSEYNLEGLSRALHPSEAGCAGRLYQTIGQPSVMVCQLLGTGSRHGSTRQEEQVGVWSFTGVCYTSWSQRVREVGRWAACSASRDLLIEQMSMLALGASSGNNAESKSQV